MPSTRSVKKQIRVAARRHLRNKSVKSQVKTNITKAEKLIFSHQLEPAQEAVVTAISSLDKAAKKGVTHRNNAARRKSRLQKKLNQAQAMPATKTETKEEK